MYLDAAPGSFLGKKIVLKLFVLAYLADEGIKKACGTVVPGPLHPRVTQ